MIDSTLGKDIGGGLFSSIKNLFKKGLTGLARGSKAALGVGRKIQTALQRGSQLAQAFEAPLASISPAASEILGRGRKTAEQLATGLQKGLQSGTQIASGIGELEKQLVAQA